MFPCIFSQALRTLTETVFGDSVWTASHTLCFDPAVICHVVGITYQHIDRWLLAEMLGDLTGEACCCLCQPEKVQVVGVGPQPAQGNPVHHFEVIIWSREG